ncbi:FUSC family protein [Novosphingobium flavum]|uniref:FUSC family protein n=2 Tax=Novosphingobium flavum TaxID=1778672 RepID=A0A7X1KMB3_9SPHN|nr:FUSC family protein [Novosphingobium flavum]
MPSAPALTLPKPGLPGPVRAVLALLPPGGLLHSVKTVAAGLLALWIALWVGLPMPFWAMTTAFIITNPLAGATRSRAVYRLGGTVIGGAVAVLLVPMLVDWPELLSLALALWLGGALAVSLLDRSPRSYVLMLAGYTSTLIAFPAVDRPEAIFDLATARVTEIVLGITCSTLVHSLFWPRSVASALGPRLRGWLADARAWQADIGRGADPAALTRDRRRLAVDAIECAQLALHVPYDTSRWREVTGVLQALLRRMLLLLPVLSGLADRRMALRGASGAWAGLLEESARLREDQAGALLAECEGLLRALEHPAASPPIALDEPRGAIAFHADPGTALLSGLSVTVATLIGCALWIGTGWVDGGTAVAMTGVFCCLFAALDNPVPSILRFGVALMCGIPLSGFYLFAVLPGVDGFVPLALLLSFPLLVIGVLLVHPRWGALGQAMIIGTCSGLAIQESFSADFAHFLNGNLAQVVAIALAAGTTAAMRTIGQDMAVARLVRRMRREVAELAARGPRAGASPFAVLGRATDRLVQVTQRLGSLPLAGDAPEGEAGLKEVRVVMNVAMIQALRATAAPVLDAALEQVLAGIAGHYSELRADPAREAELLRAIDVALALTLDLAPPRATGIAGLNEVPPEQGRPGLVALRRNLFPAAPAFAPGDPA